MYISFTTPDMLLAKLVQRFDLPRGIFPDREYDGKKKAIQLCVLYVIRLWLTDHFSHFDNKLLMNLNSVLEKVDEEPYLRMEGREIRNIVQQKKYAASGGGRGN